MKIETAKTRIANAVKRELKNETQAVKDYIANMIFLHYNCLENDSSSFTSTENLRYAIDTTLYNGDLSDLLEEARRETSK